ncbi:MAG: Rpn family recombination-promoting nuclease/putative transposase [Defluviitaleaceae bacterium]|nr:Rpn family recombination-promoting nuclease/putative transposase [Defluviitaleaceae bacterium]
MEETPLLKLKMDVVFKAIFGSEVSKEILESFLKSVLNIPNETKISLTIIDPSTKSEKKNDKTAILDVLVETEEEIINVEIQLDKDPSMVDRIVYGISKTVTNQKFKGDDYKLKKVVAIVITGYTLIETHTDYHDTFNYHSEKTGHTFSKSTEIHTLELKKLPPEDDGTMLWNWLKFKNSEERGEFEMLAQKNKEVGQAVSILKEISKDEALQMLAHNRAMAEWRDSARLLDAKAEGKLEEKRETALEMMKKDFALETISEIIKMPLTWLEELVNKEEDIQ